MAVPHLAATQSLRARRSPLADPEAQRRRLAELPLPESFEGALTRCGLHPLHPTRLEIFQINLGKLCNMTCRHCHVDAGPDRTDAVMPREIWEACFAALDRTQAHTVDLTGGAPELHPDFREIVDEACRRGKHVMDRCNLTILLAPRFEDLPRFLADRGVEVVASLPHVRRPRTDAQRGEGTFERSIEALRRLNAVGYGTGDPTRRLTLVTNPAGAYLSGSQASMEREWKTQLQRRYGVTFDRLFALNNMPISRFLEWLEATGNTEAYMQRLVEAFNPAAAEGVMCRNTLSVSWDGKVYDCDFNQMLELPADLPSVDIRHFDPEAFAQRRIVTAPHCFGCTAGAGSSCGGATT